MRHVRLIAVEDDFDSTPGLAVRGVHRGEGFMADREGRLVAHDILEHQNGAKEIGSVWDELEALGGAWFVRGQNGDMVRNGPTYHRPEVHIASDIERMFTDCSWSQEGYSPAAKGGLRAGREDDAFREIIEIAERNIRAEFRSSGDDLEEAALKAYLTEALQRLRIGYRKAAKRFRCKWHALETFRAIRDALRPVAKHCEEGREYVLHYGKGRAYVTEADYAEA